MVIGPPEAPAFHAALRAAIEARGLGLERISAHLRAKGHRISTATLSYWQSGRSAPSRFNSLAALGALEVILDVERGSLAKLATAATPASSAAGYTPRMADVVDRGRAVDQILADWGDTLDKEATIVSKQTVGWADDLGNTPRITSREVIILPPHPVETYVVAAGHPFAGVLVEITPVIGCTVRRAVSETANAFTVAQLVLPAVRGGGAHVLEYDVQFSRLPEFQRESGQCVAVAVGAVREAFVEVHFPEPGLPTGVVAVEKTAAGTVRTDVPLHGPRASVHRANFGPGTIGLEWQASPAG